MELKPVPPFFTASPQITPADVGIAASHGFRTMINNRPHGEGEAQPPSAAIEAAAHAHGLGYAYVPAFQMAMDGSAGPVPAFRRTGTRSTMLWALAEDRSGASRV